MTPWAMTPWWLTNLLAANACILIDKNIVKAIPWLRFAAPYGSRGILGTSCIPHVLAVEKNEVLQALYQGGWRGGDLKRELMGSGGHLYVPYSRVTGDLCEISVQIEDNPPIAVFFLVLDPRKVNIVRAHPVLNIPRHLSGEKYWKLRVVPTEEPEWNQCKYVDMRPVPPVPPFFVYEVRTQYTQEGAVPKKGPRMRCYDDDLLCTETLLDDVPPFLKMEEMQLGCEGILDNGEIPPLFRLDLGIGDEDYGELVKKFP